MLQEVVLINPVHSNRLKEQYCIQDFSPTGYKTSSPYDTDTLVNWVALWTPPDNNYYNLPYPGQTIFGKSYKVKKLQDKIIFQHFIQTNHSHDPRSPSKKNNTFTECTGCSFNSSSSEIPNYTGRSINCGSIVDIDLPQIINVTYFSSINSKK